MSSTDRFPLTRYFVLTSLVTAVVVASGLAWQGAHQLERELLSSSEEQAVRIARHLNRVVHLQFIHPTIARDGYVDLSEKKHLDSLDRVVKGAISEFGIVSVYFFDRAGVINYATNHEHIGFPVPKSNPNYQKASGGQVSSVIVQRGDPLDVSHQPQQVSLLETYVPAPQLDAQGAATGSQGGVIEIYQDATGLVSEIRQKSLEIALSVVLAVFVLTLALWLWIRKAERAIDERSRQLEEANDALAALSADLEQQVEDRTRRLVRAETLASVGTLGAGVAHEVNNPIAAIASCAEGLLRRASAEELTQQEAFGVFPEYLEIIRDEAFRVKEITRNLLDFSRSGSQACEPVDLGALLTAAAKLVDHRVQEERKRLELELPAEPVVLQGDAAALRQLVLNLTMNAIDASPEAGCVRWSVQATDGGAALTCEDEGPGFEPDELERAFEPFFTNKPTGRGTGLGLSIAHGVARRHGGSIQLENRPQGGARVTVQLKQGGTDA